MTHRFLMISGHDFRSPRWANMHFIARELACRGEMRFFSPNFSFVSYFNGDPRLSLMDRANRVENVRGVECFLWKSAWHPVNLRLPMLRRLSASLFRLYRRTAPAILLQWMKESDTIIVESGMPPIFMPMIRQINPHSHKIYLASDLLETIGVDPFVSAELAANIDMFDTVVLPSRRMAKAFSPRAKMVYVPHGLDLDGVKVGPSPYGPGKHAVSVGSMLFDRGLFETAAPLFPDLTFHVIGGGRNAQGLSQPNVKVYGEMPYADTLAYVKHASIGIAPYRAEDVQDYLCDTSMKLMQYEYFGTAAICPTAAVGDHRGRFGYDPANPASIKQAIESALAAGKFAPPPILSWSDVTERILRPQDFPDTAIVLAEKPGCEPLARPQAQRAGTARVGNARRMKLTTE
jgi:2-beta-glucuronyltransferase